MGRLQLQCIILVSLIAFSTATANGNGKINMKIYCYDSPGMPHKKPLHISPDNGKFRIALFADLHYGENSWTDWGPAQDNKSDKVMSVILDVETPDFVVYLGDVITANNMPVGNASLYWERALSPTRNRGIPWASVFGNHDDMPFEWPSDWFSSSGIPQIVCPRENTLVSGKDCTFKGTTRVELMAGEISNNMGLSYSDNGPRKLWPGVSNYVLQVGSAKDPKSAVSFMYFLDSGGGSYPEVISDSQVKWFQTQSEILNPDSVIPEIIFWHIPSISYKSVAPSNISGIQKPCVGSTNEENVAAQEAEWGMMNILSNRPSVKAIFVGHNHGLDWCCPSENLWLCFARHTGYGGYGNWPRGARILEITEQPFSIKSWIRMENRTMHSYVELD